MSFRKSSAVPQRNAKLSSLSAASKATQSGNWNESLLIEDLDLDDLDVSPQSAKSCNRSTDEVSYEDYTEPESNDFFGEQVPAVISETCFMNDLYILVKVPTNPRRYIPTSSKASQTLLQSPNISESSSRKIFSIQEEVEDEEEEEEAEYSVPEPRSKIPIRTQSANRIPCWVRGHDDLEEFPSKTHILPYNTASCLPNQVPEQIEVLPEEKPGQSYEPTTQPHSCHDQIQLQEVNFNSSCTKDRAKVSLDNYGILITPTKTPKSENLLVFQVDTEQKPPKSRSGGASCFDWFTKCFRRKRRRNDIMHAVVYKTYFVKWKKCAELTECPRCQCRAGRSMRRNST